jgi:hypothetical protein
MISMHANVLAEQGRTDAARAEFVRSLRTEFSLDRRNRVQRGPLAAWILPGDADEPDSLVVRIDLGRLRAGETIAERDLAGSELRRADGLVQAVPGPAALFLPPQSDRRAYVVQEMPLPKEGASAATVRIRCPKVSAEPVEIVLRTAKR